MFYGLSGYFAWSGGKNFYRFHCMRQFILATDPLERVYWAAKQGALPESIAADPVLQQAWTNRMLLHAKRKAIGWAAAAVIVPTSQIAYYWWRKKQREMKDGKGKREDQE
jgi:hypothetical protein